MDKAIIFTGKEETLQGRVENYQLIIGCKYISAIYDGSSERGPFFEEVSDSFVDMVLRERHSLVVGTFNGLKINSQTGRPERIPELEEALVSYFSERVCTKLKQSLRESGIGTTMPASFRN